MPTVTEVDEFTAQVTTPNDGDDADGASLVNTVQEVANRTMYLRTRTPGGPVLLLQPIPLVPFAIEGNGDTWKTESQGSVLQVESSNLFRVHFAVPTPPIGNNLNKPKIDWMGVAMQGNGHSGLPANRPSWTLFKRFWSGTGKVALASRHNNAGLANYEVPTIFSVSDLAIEIEFQTHYYLTVSGEYGANAVDNGMRILGAWVGFKGGY